MKNFLQQVGSFAFIIGLAAIVLNYLDMVPRILIWIYMWGEGTAWMIKIAFVGVGALIWLGASRMADPVVQEKILK